MKRRKFLQWIGIGVAAAPVVAVAAKLPVRETVHMPPRHGMSGLTPSPKPDHVWDYYRRCCICCGVTEESYVNTGSSLECEGFTKALVKAMCHGNGTS